MTTNPDGGVGASVKYGLPFNDQFHPHSYPYPHPQHQKHYHRHQQVGTDEGKINTATTSERRAVASGNNSNSNSNNNRVSSDYYNYPHHHEQHQPLPTHTLKKPPSSYRGNDTTLKFQYLNLKEECHHTGQHGDGQYDHRRHFHMNNDDANNNNGSTEYNKAAVVATTAKNQQQNHPSKDSIEDPMRNTKVDTSDSNSTMHCAKDASYTTYSTIATDTSNSSSTNVITSPQIHNTMMPKTKNHTTTRGKVITIGETLRSINHTSSLQLHHHRHQQQQQQQQSHQSHYYQDQQDHYQLTPNEFTFSNHSYLAQQQQQYHHHHQQQQQQQQQQKQQQQQHQQQKESKQHYDDQQRYHRHYHEEEQQETLLPDQQHNRFHQHHAMHDLNGSRTASSYTAALMEKKKHDANEKLSLTTPINVEISPNFYQPLRGAKETMDAIEDHFVCDCSCIICTIDFFCIRNAAWTICPLCRVLSPSSLSRKRSNTHNTYTNSSGNQRTVDHQWGVGMGFIDDNSDVHY